MAQIPREETFQGHGGGSSVSRSGRAAIPVRAGVVHRPGDKSLGGLYCWVAQQFSAKGMAAYAIDLRGRGKSEGERFYVDAVDDYADDVKRLIAIAKEREPGLPVFLLGHSAGGVVSCVYALDNQAQLAGLICESFAFKVPAPDFALAAIKALSHVAPRLPVLKLKNEDFSRNPQAVLALNSDPLTAGEVQPAQTVAALVRADERLEKEFPRMTLPVLIMHGTVDKATLARGSQFFFDTVGSADKTLKLYEGHFHDLFNDFGREGVMADTQRWIERQLAG